MTCQKRRRGKEFLPEKNNQRDKGAGGERIAGRCQAGSKKQRKDDK
jgi:hypothetical protein